MKRYFVWFSCLQWKWKRKNRFAQASTGESPTPMHIPRPPDSQASRFPDPETPRLTDSQTPRLPCRLLDSQTPRLPGFHILRPPDSQIPRPPDSHSPRLPDSHNTGLQALPKSPGSTLWILEGLLFLCARGSSKAPSPPSQCRSS